MVTFRAKYSDYQPFADALRALKDSDFRQYEAYGPVELAELEDLMPKQGSPVRVWATVGAIVGLVSFWLMCVASSLIYSLIVGGKPPISNVPFVIVSYEGTILLGAIAAFIAILVVARLRARRLPRIYDSSFSGDCFGIMVRCAPEERKKVTDLLIHCGAIEIDELK